VLSPDFQSRLLNSKRVLFFLILLCTAIVGVTAYRTYQRYSPPSSEFDWANRGLSDFHNGVYLPTQAFRDGVNPYSLGVLQRYEMARQTPLYSPAIFILHLPLSYLGLPAADVTFFCASTLLMAGLCGLAVGWGRSIESKLAPEAAEHRSWIPFLCLTLIALCLLLLSRPGHVTLFTGYFTLELVFGTVIALHYAEKRPGVSGVGILLASGKPTYVLPLIIVMFARQNFRALIFGVGFCIVVGVSGLAWLASFSSWQTVLSDIQQGQANVLNDPIEMPINTWTRVDIAGLVAKGFGWHPPEKIYLLAMFPQLAVVAFFIGRIAKYERQQPLHAGVLGPSAIIGLLAITISIYHHAYDTLLVFVPIVSLLFFAKTALPLLPNRYRFLALGLSLVPMLNFVSTKSVRDKLDLDPYGFVWQSITMINGISLLLALVVLIIGYSRTYSESAVDGSDA